MLAVAGHRLEYARLAARRPGPTLVLLHEGLGCVAMWKRFPAALAAATGLAVFSYSRAGYGGSSPVTLPRPIDFHTREAVDVLPRLLDAAGIGECVFIGHSDGASIALIYTGASADPRVVGLAAMAPHVLTEQKCVASVRDAIDAFEHGDLRARLARYHGDNIECAFRGWSDTWIDARFAAWNIERYLAGIRVPVLTLRGDKDPYNTRVHVEKIAAGVTAEVTSISLPGCGHAPHAESEAVVTDHLRTFLASLERDA